MKSQINYLFLICLNVQVTLLFGQSISLEKIINGKNDTVKCRLLVEASEYYKYKSVDTLLLVADALINTAEKIKSNLYLESAYNIKSTALKFKGQFASAIEYAQKALDLNTQRNDKGNRSIILLNYADLMRQQKQFVASERYHKEGIRLSQTENDSTLLAKFYINTGLLFSDMGRLDTANHYYRLGIAITDQVPAIQNIGITARLNLSQLASKQGKYEDMISLAMQVYAYGVKQNDVDHISLGANNVAVGYVKLGQYDKGLEIIQHAEDAARKYNSPQNLLYALGTASDIHAEKGDYKSAYEKALAYIGLKDSLRTALYDENLMEITTKYELKEKENLLARHQLTIQKQSTRQRMIIALSVIMLIAIFLIFLYLKNRQELQRKTAEVEAEKAHLEAKLEHAEVERLKELDTLRSNFFANISHEFRTPLTLILNPTEQLLKDNLKTVHKKYLQIIHRNAHRMLGLVNQLLDISKLETGHTLLNVGYYDLKKFCLMIFGLFESLCKQNELEYTIILPEVDIKGYFDKDVLEKILVNLISNAFKFTPAGGSIELTLSCHEEGNVEISVKDSGIGISKENIDLLFDRFRSFSHSTLQSGSGIGLSLVYELVQLHKGKINVQSEMGVGSIFSITLNLDKNNYSENEIIAIGKEDYMLTAKYTHEHFLEEGIDAVPFKILPEHYTENKPVLLIAEDNPDVRYLITNICNEHFQIISAENGKVAYEIATEKIPDILITDVMMPEMDGTELCASLRKHELTCHIPIVMLTARGDQKDKIEGFKTGADDYLVKPFDADELLVRLNNLLEQRIVLREYYKKVLTAFTPLDEPAEAMDAVFIGNLKEAIELNMHSESYSVSDLASDLNLSRSQLHRKVKGLLGYAPNEVIRNMRLEKARMLIGKKVGSISEIAYQCGFSSPAYFSKCYKDYFGHTAGEAF